MCLGVFVVSLVRGIMVARRHLELSPDGTEYLAVARSLLSGSGYQLPLHIYHVCEPYRAVHSAWAFRLPVYPALLAAFSALVAAPIEGFPPPRLYVLNLLLAALACAVAALVAYRLSLSYGASPRSAMLAAVISAWALMNATPLLYCAVNLYSEPVALLLALAALALTLTPVSPTPTRAFAGGFAAGLAAQARGELIILPLALALMLLLRSMRPSKGRDRTAGTATGWAIMSVTLGAVVGFLPLKLLAAASPLCGHASVYAFHFRVASFKVLLDGGEPAPSALAFIRTHPRLIASLIWRNAQANATVVLTPTSFLLGPAIILACFRPEMLPGLLMLGVSTAMWFVCDANRFMLVPLGLCAPVCGASIASAWERWDSRLTPVVRRTTTVLAIAALTMHFGLASRRFEDTTRLGADPLVWNGPDLPGLATRLREGLAVGEAFAATAPWPLYLATNHPGVLIPAVSDREMLQRFLEAHPDVRAVVQRPAAPYAGAPEEWPEWWLSDARWERVGDDRIAWLPGSRRE
jgi:hypothetical protein